MIELYPFQRQLLDELRAGYAAGHRCQLCALATGGGKTVVASHAIKASADRGTTAMFIVDRVELVMQAARTLAALGLKVGTFQGDNTKAPRLILDRVYPPLRACELPITLDLPEGGLADQARAVLQAVARGTVTPDQGSKVLNGLGTTAKLRELDELEARIARLEEWSR
jgi:hypothetical protein